MSNTICRHCRSVAYVSVSGAVHCGNESCIGHNAGDELDYSSLRSTRSGRTAIWSAASLIVLFLGILFLGPTACTVGQSTAEEVLADEGYHDVELTGWAPMSCSDDDAFKSHFRARRTVVAPDGSRHEREVEGTICCGWFKDCTVRH